MYKFYYIFIVGLQLLLFTAATSFFLSTGSTLIRNGNPLGFLLFLTGLANAMALGVFCVFYLTTRFQRAFTNKNK